MHYSILIYAQEDVTDRLSEDEVEAILQKHRDLQAALTKEGKLGPVAKLMGTSTAVTVATQGNAVVVLDGPFAETKEQLLGFYIVECETIEEAIEAAKQLPQGIATMEVRPIAWLGGPGAEGS